MQIEIENPWKPRNKVLIIADQPVVRYGFARLLSQESDIDVYGETRNAAEALREIDMLRPDLVTIGLPLDGAGHHDVIERLRTNHAKLKILTAIRHEDPHLAGRLLRAGANGCIHWGEPLPRIVEAIQTVLRGEVYVSGRVAKRLCHGKVNGASVDGNPARMLSDRELDVFTMIGQGRTTQEIASQLKLSPRTIETHRKKIKVKLGLETAAQLSRCAFQWLKNDAE
jgi:DNA-binding NarL/FixJ family response regulator